MNGYIIGTNSEKNISPPKKHAFNGCIVLFGVKPTVLLHFGKIFNIVSLDLFKKWLNLGKNP